MSVKAWVDYVIAPPCMRVSNPTSTPEIVGRIPGDASVGGLAIGRYGEVQDDVATSSGLSRSIVRSHEILR